MSTMKQANLLTPHDALEEILNHTSPLDAEFVDILESNGRILTENIYAKQDLPPFDNSAMDGYAVQYADVVGASKENPRKLKVVDFIRAGQRHQPVVKSGEAVKIMTGAPIPMGADTVVIKEATQEQDGFVQVFYEFNKGDHIRRLGEDVRLGAGLLEQGTRIRPNEIALLAAQGIDKFPVVRRPHVCVIATGDELVHINQPALAPGKIRNSNGPAILAGLKRWRISCEDGGIVKDDPAEIEQAFRNALEKSDVLVVTGGVSVGDFDFTLDVLNRMGMQRVFWKVAIKPGKPLLFGTIGKKLIFGLPGNPISSLVCLEEFVRPALEKLQGFSPHYPSYHLRGKVKNFFNKTPKRQQYIFCRVWEENGQFQLQIIRPQGSAMLGMASSANALAVAPIGLSKINEGDELAFRWLK